MNVGQVRWREIGEFMIWFLALSMGLVLGPWLYFSTQSIFLQLLLLAAAGGFWLLAAWRRRAPVSTALDAPIVTFLLVSAIAAYFSVDPGRSWRVVWYWACYVLFLYAAVAALRRGWKPRIASRALLIVVGVLLIFAYYQLFRQIAGWRETLSWLAPLPPKLIRVWGITDSPNTFGAIIGTTLPFALAYRRRAEGTGRLWPWLWLLLALPILLLTRSRGGMVAAGVGFVLFWQRGLLIQLRSGKLSGAAALRRLGAVGLFLVVIAAAMIAVRPNTLNLLRDTTLSNRFGYWTVAADMAATYPWTGAGPHTFATFFLQQMPSNELIAMPHNLFLSALSMGGMAGLFVLLWLGVAAALAAWRADLAGWSDWAWAALAALGALLAYAQLDIIMVRPALLYIIVLCGAILLASLPDRPRDAAAPRRALLLRAGWTGLWILLLVSGVRDWQASQWYDAGVQAMEEGDWAAATEAFARGRDGGALDDTAFLYAEALSRGTLAFSEPAALDHAIANYEQLLEAEPGWSANHANLAALYWQKGLSERARARMEVALDLAPDVSLYWLNAGLWAEASGDASVAGDAYRQAYLRGEPWDEAPLWATAFPVGLPAGAAGSGSPLVAAGNEMLSAGDYAGARGFFQQAAAEKPFDPQGYLGLGITAFLAGDEDAGLLLTQASQLSANRSGVGRTWEYHSLITLWQLALEHRASPDVLAVMLENLLASPRMLRSGLANYPYLRASLPVDMVPQLSCLTVSDTTAWHVQLMRRHFAEQGEEELVERLDALLWGDGRGVETCGG